MVNLKKSKRPHYPRRGKVELSPLRIQIEERLLTQGPSKVARWLKLEGQPISEKTLRKYRNDFILPRNLLLRALSRGSSYTDFRNQLIEKIDALKELHKLAQMQMKRLSIGLEVEENKKTMTGTVNSGMDLLRKILLDIVNLEMDLGIRRRVASRESSKGMSDFDFEVLLKRVMTLNKRFTESKEETN